MNMALQTTLALASLLAAQRSSAFEQEQEPVAQQAFAPGEEMVFSVDFLHVPTGEGRVTVGRPEGSIWPIICQGRTGGLASLLDIREYLVSYWDSVSGQSRGSDLHAMELGDRHTDISRFDREQGKATIRIQRRGRHFQKTFDAPSDVRDIASALMYLRLKDLSPGNHFEVPVFTGKEIFNLIADVQERESLTTPAGKFETLRVRVRTAFKGKFSTSRDSFVWVTDDHRHVPVRLSADFAVGSVVATMKSYTPGGELAKR
jgi:hypothetical protein